MLETKNKQETLSNKVYRKKKINRFLETAQLLFQKTIHIKHLGSLQ